MDKHQYSTLIKIFIATCFVYTCSAEDVSLRNYAKFSGKVGAGNFSYYSLQEAGDVTFVLKSILGDADIYVAQQKDLLNVADYELSSVTCGIDTVVVPASFSRPVHIGVYGHIHHTLSKYTLYAIVNGTDTNLILENISNDNFSNAGSSSDDNNSSFFSSFVWELLETLLQILLEVLL
uniref:Cnidarian restricted protein n=1 Tax=Clytia hemisphaerica TaxID=252671 RepID=A0A7M5UDR8_9CNID